MVSNTKMLNCWFKHTELDSWVVLTDLLALLVGEEHVSGKTMLGRIGV